MPARHGSPRSICDVTRLEGDTRITLLDPALHAAGWTEELIRREETPGAIEIVDGRPRRAGTGRTDYTLRIKVMPNAQPVAVAVVEAKRADAAPTRGLDQAKEYAREYARSAARMHVPFVFSTNGHQWVEFDATTGLTTAPAPMTEFPSPNELRVRWEAARGLDLTSELARPLSTPYRGGETSRRYYQDAAIRAVLEKIARGETRALLSLATGAGKTYIAVHLLRRLADAGLLRRALFLVDRDELRNQALGALQNAFGADAAAVSGGNLQTNARVLVATYQTLGLDRLEGRRGPRPGRRPVRRPGRRRRTRARARHLPRPALPARLFQLRDHRRVPPLRLGRLVDGADPERERRPGRPHRDAAPADDGASVDDPRNGR
jgi:type I restriction enzyme R subunit